MHINMTPKIKLLLMIHVYVLPFLLHTAAQEQYPSVSCPDIFKYAHDSNFGGYHGLITVQRDGTPTSVLQVNMSMNTQTPVNSNIKIEVLSKQNEIFYGDTIRYAVRFPTQGVIPKLTEIQFNKRVLCSAEPDPLSSGIIQTSMWAQSSITTYNGPVQSQPTTTIKAPQEQKPSFQLVFGVPPSSTNNNWGNAFGAPANPFLPSFTNKKEDAQGNVFDIPVNPFVPAFTNKGENEKVTPAPQPATSSVNPVTSSTIQCGVTRRTQNLIIGGEGIGPGDFPWLAAIMHKEEPDYKLHCTGNLISDKHVLTAGHCFRFHNAPLYNTEDFLVILGKLNTVNWQNGGTVRNAKLIESHPNYKQDFVDYDVAVILLSEPVKFRATIRPICLWDRSEDLGKIIGQNGTVVGWYREEGEELSSVAQKVVMPIVSQETCLWSNKVFKKYTSARTFCAGTRDNAKGPCTGDSGAGFMLKDPTTNQWFLRGLVGWSLWDPQTLKCDLNHYVIFIDVAKIVSWIEEQVEKD